MISKEHKKHSELQRPAFGNYHRNEWSFVGGPCTIIKLLAGQVIKALSVEYKCAYIDTAHQDGIVPRPGMLANEAHLEYTGHQQYTQLNYNASFDQFKLRGMFSGDDAVFVNGNHHQAKEQVVIISETKRASLQKRVDQLTSVQMILLDEGADDIFDFVKEAVPGWEHLPLYKITDTAEITAFFQRKMQLAKPLLNGLVLAGGKSERMQFDKGAINWHGKEQRYHVADLLKPFCKEVFISCRADQRTGIDSTYKTLADTFTGLGPFGAILSAFREHPDRAWLVVACDLPLITPETLSFLTGNRNVSSVATAFKSTYNNFPEPLITIWEPRSYVNLLQFLSQGYCCPRKVLINTDVTVLQAPDTTELTNVNTPEERVRVEQLLNQKTKPVNA